MKRFLIVIFSSISSFISAQTSLIAYYSFDGDANDYSGNNYHGVVHDNETYIDGIDGDALQFDGINDWVELTNFSVPETFAISMWVNTTSSTKSQAIVAKNRTLDTYQPQAENVFLIGSWGPQTIDVNIDGGQQAFTSTETGWHHICINVSKTNTSNSLVSMYYDNVFLSEKEYTTSLSDLGTNPWVLGMELDNLGNLDNDQSDFFQGAMDEVRFYGRNLSMDDVSKLFNKDIPTYVFKNSINTNVSFFPNPADDRIKINVEKVHEIKVYTSNGSHVKTYYSDNINISQLNKGVYFLEVKCDKGNFTEKLIKI